MHEGVQPILSPAFLPAQLAVRFTCYPCPKLVERGGGVCVRGQKEVRRVAHHHQIGPDNASSNEYGDELREREASRMLRSFTS